MSDPIPDFTSLDSYIYVDSVESKKTIRMQCSECHKGNGLGSPWPARNGYGPWDISCRGCGKAIHRKPTGVKGDNDI